LVNFPFYIDTGYGGVIECFYSFQYKHPNFSADSQVVLQILHPSVLADAGPVGERSRTIRGHNS